MSGIPFKGEKEYPVVYKEQTLIHSFYTDFVIYDRIILKVKGISSLKEEHVAQCINYLKASGNSLALLVNFGEPKLLSKRVVL
ncbi:MAG: GxxExxY protein [Bacteroidota bacterium]